MACIKIFSLTLRNFDPTRFTLEGFPLEYEEKDLGTKLNEDGSNIDF